MTESHPSPPHTNGAPPVTHATSAERADVAKKVLGARLAQESWRAKSLDDRIALLEGAAKQMLRRRAEVMALAKEEMGKVAAEGLFNEALGPLDTVKAWARVVRRGTARRHVRLNPISFPKKRAHVDLVPRGVVGIIAPWNFPVAGLYRTVLPALMTGNGVVVKPSEFTPKTSGWFIERLAEALPLGLLALAPGDGTVGEALVLAGIDACVFTGSPRVGKMVRLRCAERGIPCSVEMGGKDAAIVLADCDLPRTVAALTHWTLSNAGQACGAVEIVYVEKSIADDLVERLRRAFSKLDRDSVAPLANDRQLAIVTAQVDDARAKGARVVTGGTGAAGGRFYPPTVLDQCNDGMTVVTDETFGPVLAVVRVEGATEAIRAVNASRYGLGASIWTRDIARAERLAERLEVGIVNVNNHSFTGAIPELPWTGTRDTGFGVANSELSLATFVRPRTLAVDTSSGPDVYWMPYDHVLLDLGELLADAQIGKLGGAWKILPLMRRRLKTIRAFFT